MIQIETPVAVAFWAVAVARVSPVIVAGAVPTVPAFALSFDFTSPFVFQTKIESNPEQQLGCFWVTNNKGSA